VTKPEAGHLAKAGVEAGEIIQEFRVASDVAAQYQPGAVVAATAVFAAGQKVDVQGTSIRTTCRAPSPWHKTQVACSPARK